LDAAQGAAAPTRDDFWEFLEYTAPPSTVTTLWLEAGYDTAEIADYRASLTANTGGGWAVWLAAAKSIYADTDPAFEPITYVAGAATPIWRAVRFDLEYEHWGTTSQLDTDTLRAGLMVLPPGWALTVRPEWRDVTLYTRPIAGRQREAQGSSEGVYGQVSYTGLRRWQFTLAGAKYEYSFDPHILGTRRAETLLSAQALRLAQTFLDRATTVELGYDFDQAHLALARTHSISAIDDSRADTSAVRVDFSLTHSMRMLVEVSSVDYEVTDTQFVRAGLGYTWY
jgi:hypothetical protein